jgi:hypothetical protein
MVLGYGGMSIPFRAAAVDRYRARRAENAAPALSLPRTRTATWLVGGLLVGVMAMAWFIRLPVYVPGVAVIVDSPQGPQIATLVAADSLPRLQVGQAVHVAIGGNNQRLHRTITQLDGASLSPDDVPRRLALSELARGMVVMLDGPTTIAFAPLESVPGQYPAKAYVGSVVRADVEVGTRSILGLVPPFDRLAGEG